MERRKKENIELIINPTEYGFIKPKHWTKVRRTLEDIYGELWTEAYYDPANKKTQEFAKPLADKLAELNKLVRFKK